MKKLGIEKQGFHGFRRFRVTHLESSAVPTALVKYWTGHARTADGAVIQQTVTDRYVKMAKDTQFRAEVAERIGDVAIVMNGLGTVKDWVSGEPRHLHIGNHGGMSEDEMNIPLVVAKT